MLRSHRSRRAGLRAGFAALETLESRQLLSVTAPAWLDVPEYRHAAEVAPAHPLAKHIGRAHPMDLGEVTPLISPPSAYSLTPAQVKAAYGFDQITGDGTGQTIAIVDAYDAPGIYTDANIFDRQFAVSNTDSRSLFEAYGSSGSWLTKVSPQKGKPKPDSGWIQEISLDVEWAHAMAPGAKILLVEAASNSIADLLGAVNVAAQRGADVVSMSWGAGEFSSEASYDSYFSDPTVTYIASSGDSGNQSWPAISTNVLAVGGTTLKVNKPLGTYNGETGWKGSGGGISRYVSKPSYQNAVTTPSATYRTNPDIAYNASPSTGVAIYDSHDGVGWMQIGGTSAGAPQWASIVAIADQARGAKGPLGYAQTLNAIYGLANGSHAGVADSDLNDVTSGNNNVGYATTGYDLVTGRGTPKVNRVVPVLINY